MFCCAVSLYMFTSCAVFWWARKASENGLLTKCEVKMAGYCPSSFFACLLLTEWEGRTANYLARCQDVREVRASWPNGLTSLGNMTPIFSVHFFGETRPRAGACIASFCAHFQRANDLISCISSSFGKPVMCIGIPSSLQTEKKISWQNVEANALILANVIWICYSWE